MFLKVKINGQRLDGYLASELNISRNVAQNLILSGKVLVNQKRIKNSYIVSEGDEIQYELMNEKSNKLVAENIPLDIIFEDEYLAVIYKPFGMVTHPAYGHSSGTLVNALMHHFQNLAQENNSERKGIVHRLDKDTEGLMVIAKTNDVRKKLADMFKKHEIEKKYYAIVKGDMGIADGKIDFPIGRNPKNRKKYMAYIDIKNVKVKLREALTYFEVIKRKNNLTLLKVIPKTGRTHQIRVHLASIGYPVLGDPLYSRKNTSGQYLQAYYLSFQHPITKKVLKFEKPINARLAKAIGGLN